MTKSYNTLGSLLEEFELTPSNIKLIKFGYKKIYGSNLTDNQLEKITKKEQFNLFNYADSEIGYRNHIWTTINHGYAQNHKDILTNLNIYQLGFNNQAVYYSLGVERYEKYNKKETLKSIGWVVLALLIIGIVIFSNINKNQNTSTGGNCNSNYSGCVPNSSSDLDCADIGHRVNVIGVDVYGLDRDGDGIGCESY